MEPCLRGRFPGNDLKGGNPESCRTGAVFIPGGSVVKNPPAMQETWVQSLGQEDLLEKAVATHSSILAWRIS